VFKQKIISKNLARNISHFGFGILVFSIFINAYLSKEINVPIKVGQTIKQNAIEIQFKNILKSQGKNFEEIIGNFLIKDGTRAFELSPSLRKYLQPAQVTSETSIKSTLFGDYYLAINLSEFEGDKIMIRFYHKPLMLWIWISIAFIIFGGLIRIFRKQNES
jgi:cytochrome c-type biogenesis protein CcmF